jgi:hypothetical protein
MLLVVDSHLLANGLVQLLGHDRVAHAETPDLRRHATHDVLRQFAFVRLADPAALGEFLQHSGAFAFGVTPPQHEHRVEPDQDQRADQAAPEERPETATRRSGRWRGCRPRRRLAGSGRRFGHGRIPCDQWL